VRIRPVRGALLRYPLSQAVGASAENDEIAREAPETTAGTLLREGFRQTAGGIARDCFGFTVERVENGNELGDRQQVVIPRAYVKQLEPAASLRERGIARDQLPESAAIDVRHGRQIHDHARAPLQHEALALVLEQLCPFVDCQLPAQVEDSNRVNDAFGDLHG
jgi:hypothetical protein